MVKLRKLFLFATLALAIVCGLLIPRVNVNNDMTKYLPDDSRMRTGLDIIKDEFPSAANMGGTDVRILCHDLDEQEQSTFADDFRAHPDVNSVTIQKKDNYTLYEIGMSKEIDQREFGNDVKTHYDKVVDVETSQDGSTAESWYLILGCIALFLILFAMCKSWLEPVLFMASTGVAVAINLGTNALLPSVSATTASMVAILQLVLSMDYSIILLNRYRQEVAAAYPNGETETKQGNIAAMSNAVRKAAPSILSSGLTTIVGLLMLVFMKLKIGMDLGVVLSKGVLCSLICNFTVLPSLLLWCHQPIIHSHKKTLPLPTDKLAAFSMRHRIPLAILFVVLFAGSYWLHNRTPIVFSMDNTNKVSEVFPQKNTTVVVYDNDNEDLIVSLADSISADTNVEMVLSYPSLLLREYTAHQMFDAINQLTSLSNNDQSLVDSTGLAAMLTEDMLHLLFYTHHAGRRQIKLSIDQMASFLISQANDPTSLLAGKLDSDMKEKLSLLKEFQASSDSTEQASDSLAFDEPKVDPSMVAEEIPEDEIEEDIFQEEIDNLPPTLPAKSPYTDTAMLLRPMTSNEMAAYLGMDRDQAKMVYRLAKKDKLTPVEFVHFINDQVLSRKAFASMVSPQQKLQFHQFRESMDATLAQCRKQAKPIPSDTIQPKEQKQRELLADREDDKLDSIELSVLSQLNDSTLSDDAIDQLDSMLSSGQRYTAKEMSENLKLLGEEIDPRLLDLLYLYYGSSHRYNKDWTLSFEQVMADIENLIFNDRRFNGLVDKAAQHGFTQMQQAMTEGLGQLRGDNHSLMIVISNHPFESAETYQFIRHIDTLCNQMLQGDHYSIGQSVMYAEMKDGFGREMTLVTILTVLAIFIIVALTFRSLLIPLFLILTVMTAVYINVTVSGLNGGTLIYMAYLIVQSILIGATIDYGILFTNYYRELRTSMPIAEALQVSYRRSIHTILTSGLILIIVPGLLCFVMTPDVGAICRNISLGALAAVLMILLVLPGLLAACDKLVVKKQK